MCLAGQGRCSVGWGQCGQATLERARLVEGMFYRTCADLTRQSNALNLYSWQIHSFEGMTCTDDLKYRCGRDITSAVEAPDKP